jgi:hypothetical protein
MPESKSLALICREREITNTPQIPPATNTPIHHDPNFEAVPLSLTGSVEDILHSFRNEPMGEDELRNELNELHALRLAINRIDPTHPYATSLDSPFFPPSSYKAISMPVQCQLARKGYRKTTAVSSIDEALRHLPSILQPTKTSEETFSARLEDVFQAVPEITLPDQLKTS